jgi:hypothetical protein
MLMGVALIAAIFMNLAPLGLKPSTRARADTDLSQVIDFA